MKKTWKKLQALLSGIAQLRIPVYSGNAAFFLLMSLFPAAMLLLTVLQYIPASTEDLIVMIESVMPPPLYPLLNTIVADLGSGRTIAVLSVAAIASLWSASRGVSTLLFGLDAVYHLEERRSYLHRRAISFIFTLVVFLALVCTVLLQVFGRSIYAYIQANGWDKLGLFAVIIRLRSLFSAGFLTLLFALCYTVLPCGRLRFVRQLPGAALSAGGWLIFSALFAYYVEHFGNYSVIYGSLTTVILTMLWLYFCLMILFYGGLFNYALARYKRLFHVLGAYLRS